MNRRVVIFTGSVVCTALLSGCATPASRIDRRAQEAGLERIAVSGVPFAHLIYRNPVVLPADGTGLLVVFLEGDGTPWSHGGRIPAADPTPWRPLALDLLLTTALPALYLTRPCYYGMAGPCTAERWTQGRYSQTVVDSLVAALQRYLRDQQDTRVLLVGYSGGGTLATLMAPYLATVANVAGVVTIAANLDTARWTGLHGYLPLDGSLNPALQPAPDGIPEIHLVGGRDANVPPHLLDGYHKLHPRAVFWRYNTFDHRCCWVDEWPVALGRIERRLAPAGSKTPQ